MADSTVADAIITTGEIRPTRAPTGRQSTKNGRLIAAGTAATTVADLPASVKIHCAADHMHPDAHRVGELDQHQHPEPGEPQRRQR